MLKIKKMIFVVFLNLLHHNLIYHFSKNIHKLKLKLMEEDKPTKSAHNKSNKKTTQNKSIFSRSDELVFYNEELFRVEG